MNAYLSEGGNTVKRPSKRKYFLCPVIMALLCMSSALQPRAVAQSLSSTTLALYPADTGELAFADLRALRQSPHYARLRNELLPPRLRELESFAQALGMDLEIQSQQMSWAFAGAARATAPAAPA